MRVCSRVSWVRLDALWGPSWDRLGPQKRTKVHKKLIQKSNNISIHLGIDFGTNFNRFSEGKWRQVGDKIASKIKFSENKKNAFGASPLVPT